MFEMFFLDLKQAFIYFAVPIFRAWHGNLNSIYPFSLLTIAA